MESTTHENGRKPATQTLGKGWKRTEQLNNLSKEALVQKILSLEDSQYAMKLAIKARYSPVNTQTNALASSSSSSMNPNANAESSTKRISKADGFRKHPTRKIALLFAYQGWHYAGLAIQPTYQATQTVEGELLAALEKTHLIEQDVGWDGCGFSRCGRTDRGVSSAGQVVTLWVKSKRRRGDGGEELEDDWREAEEPVPEKIASIVDESNQAEEKVLTKEEKVALKIQNGQSKKTQKQPIQAGPGREFSYPSILNRVLPPTIRVLAWSPLPNKTEFDARFSTLTRHYRYFFSSDPLPGRKPLDLSRMQDAANRLLGENDFRNFCKLDGAKQIDNYYRTVLRAEIRKDPPTGVPESAGGEDCVFELVGSAFLWHQVRHIMAILLLIGHGLEEPEVVTSLLNTGVIAVNPMTGEVKDVKPSRYTTSTPPLVNRPQYQMAAALPLQLFRCAYAPGEVDWRYGSFDGPKSSNPREPDIYQGVEGLLKALKSEVMEAKIKARHVESFYEEALRVTAGEDGLAVIGENNAGQILHSIGGGESLSTKKYIPLMDKPRADSSDDVNAKWRSGAKFQKRNAAAPVEDAAE